MFKRLRGSQPTRQWLSYLMLTLVIIGINSGIVRAEEPDFTQIYDYQFTVNGELQHDIHVPSWLPSYQPDRFELEVQRQSQILNETNQKVGQLVETALQESMKNVLESTALHALNFLEIGDWTVGRQAGEIHTLYKQGEMSLETKKHPFFSGLVDLYQTVVRLINPYGLDQTTFIQESGHFSSHSSTSQPGMLDNNYDFIEHIQPYTMKLPMYVEPSDYPGFLPPVFEDPALKNDSWQLDHFLTQHRLYDGTVLDDMKWIHQMTESPINPILANPILTNPTWPLESTGFNPLGTIENPYVTEPLFNSFGSPYNPNNSLNLNFTSPFDNR